MVKRGGSREEFDRDKVLGGMVVACRKRPVSLEALRKAADRIERDLFDLMAPEVTSTEIGERVMQALAGLDAVAFVRFASVYREFDSPAEFAEIVETVRKLQLEQTANGAVAEPGLFGGLGPRQ